MSNKTLLFIIFCLALLMSIVACSNDDSGLNRGKESDPVSELIQEFQSSVNPGSRAGGSFRIKNINTKYYHIENDTIIETLPTKAETEDFSISTVNLQFENSEGYAVLSTDKNMNRIFLYSEKGQVSDSAFSKPLKYIIEGIPYVASEMIQSQDLPARVTDEDLLIKPIVRVHWGQEYPYNFMAKYCDCTKCKLRMNHTPIGCVATAVAQFFATTGKFKGTFYGSKDLDFKTIPVDSEKMGTSDYPLIAHFFHEIALCCQTQYGCDGSGSNIKVAYHYLRDMGYICDFDKRKIEPQKVITELKNGYPHLIGGFSIDGGHVWLIDGITINDGGYYYHCNWGVDGSYGSWCYNNNFGTYGNNPYNRDIQHIYINGISF